MATVFRLILPLPSLLLLLINTIRLYFYSLRCQKHNFVVVDLVGCSCYCCFSCCCYFFKFLFKNSYKQNVKSISCGYWKRTKGGHEYGWQWPARVEPRKKQTGAKETEYKWFSAAATITTNIIRVTAKQRRWRRRFTFNMDKIRRCCLSKVGGGGREF